MENNVLQQLKENIAKVMIGNERTIELVLTCLVAKGHILLEDVPGTGKTVMAKSLAKSVEAEFGRIQFTPDLLQSDVTGLNYFDAKSGEFVFSKGPAFCNILLADEINRATPKTQSSLLECMAERQITVDGVTRPLEEPFLVILDGVTDPHNLGAIIRSAECAGAHGVIIPERRAVGLTPAAVKASAGAVEYLPVAREVNLTRTIERLKKEGIWIYGTAMNGEDYRKVDYSGAKALVIGSEGEGMSRLVSESCDKVVTLPMKGKIESLNASVAAGILLYAMMDAK